MSGWIKWEKDLDSDPRVLRMARELKRLCNAPDYPAVTLLCGALVRLWSYADTHIREDDTLDLGCAEIDELIGIENFCSLVPSDWLREIDEHTVELPGFQSHNGVEAKKRALTQKRVQKHRNAHSVTEALPDQDQTKTRLDQDQKKKDTTASPPRGDEASVFQHWQREWSHPTAKLDDKRKKRIQARLKDFTAEQLCNAISGFKHSAWHNGTDPKGSGTVYDGIDTLLRDTEQVEKGLQMFLHPPRPPPKADELSPIDRVRLANGVKRDERVVAEQFGQSDGDLDSADGDVRRSSYAGFRRLGS
jgi:hypothetical protein